MILRFTLIIVLFVLNSFSYGQTSNITEGCVPLQVNFTAPGSASTYFWDFKDGATSTIQNPSNTFISSGTYVVEFSESSGGPIVGTVTITVYNQPDPSIVATSATVGCVPFTLTVEDNTTLPAGVVGTGFSWSFGDGGSGASNPVSYTYNAEGVYNVTLQLSTSLASCNATKIFPAFVTCTESPVTGFTTAPNPALACTPPLNVGFSNTTTSGSALTYSWDFGNGNNSAEQNPLPQAYTAQGNYTVTLTATDTNGCVGTFNAPVTIGQPTSSFIIPDTVCIATDVIPLNTSSAGNYFWNFGPNATPSTSTDGQPLVQFTATGLQTITLSTTSSGGGCTHDTTVTIFVEEATAHFTSTPTYACFEPATFTFTGDSPNNVISWDWTFDGGATDNGETVSYDYAENDTSYAEDGETIYETTLTITTASGCTAEYKDVDTIHLPWARFMPDVAEGCAPLTVTFSDSSRSNTPLEPISQWEWDYGDGNNDVFTNGDPNTYVFTTPGVYDVTLIITNIAGCTDTSDTIHIEVGDIVTVDFSAIPTSICPGEQVTFTNLSTGIADVDAWHYTTDEDRMTHCFDEDNPAYVFDHETGFFDVTLTAEYNGCYSSATKSNYIEVKGPIADFNYQQDCSTPMDVIFSDSSSSATSISWDFGDGNTSTVSPVNHTYAATGDYTVILTATNAISGCPDDKDTAIVHIRTIEAKFTTDSLLCGNQTYTYDGTNSIDVSPHCFRGYTWFFSEPSMRPITTPDPTEDINLNVSGPQTIGLVVEDINGCVDSLIHSVIVYNSLPAFELDDSTICFPATVSFTDLSTSDTAIVDWSWDFGDGNTANTQNTNNTYVSGPVAPITVSLTVTDKIGCTNTETFDISVYQPVSFLSTLPNPPNVCTDETINFFASDFTSQGSSLSFDWDFGDGNNSTNQNPPYSYSSEGLYNVVLTFTEIATGCQGSKTKVVNVQSYPTASFLADNDTVCASPAAIINFTNLSTSSSGITSYLWDFGNGQSSTLQDVNTSYNPGIYPVELIVTTSNGCSDTVQSSVTVIGLNGSFTMSPSSICKGDSIVLNIGSDTSGVWAYEWDFGDGSPSESNISPVNHPYNSIPPSGTYPVKLTLYSIDSICSTSMQQTVSIYQVIAGFVILEDSICNGTLASFTNTSTGQDINTWTLGDGNTSTSSTNFGNLYAGPGSYTVNLTVESSTLGCTDDTTATVVVFDSPSIVAIGDTICPGSTGQLDVENFDASNFYNWSPGGLVSNSTIHNPVTTTDTAIYYTVTITNSDGCSNSDSAQIYVVPTLTGVDFDTIVIIGDSIMLPIDNQSGLLNFSWNPEDGLSCIDCSNPGVGPLLEDINYSVFVTDKYNCSGATYNFYIEVVPETRIELPTTFTPNGDGTNDIIFIGYWGVKELYEFQIFNRWGELVFETTNIDEGWNGYYKNILQNNDIYVYKVRALTWLDEEIYKEGHIHLMR